MTYYLIIIIIFSVMAAIEIKKDTRDEGTHI